MLGPRLDFTFAFNDTAFSNRVLHIHIMDDSLDSKSDSEGCDCDCFRSRKRKGENLDHEKECSAAVAQSKTLHINSAILAANSPLFYKLFKNGMRESHQRDDVTLRINASEEAALMELLNFMYNGTISVTTAPDVLGVLIVADKFEVTSCVNYCTHLLQQKLMSQESAILYLELHSCVFMGQVVQPLIDAAKQYLVVRYRNLYNSQEDAMALPLCAIEVVLGSDELRLYSEDTVFDFVLKWARAHYPDLEKRQEILTNHLARLIRFPYMSSSRLKQVLACADFDQQQVSKLVLEALLFKAEASNCGFTQRFYYVRPATVVQFESHCVVYFDLKKEDCAYLSRSRASFYSQPFSLAGRSFHLGTICSKDPHSSLDQFGLFVMCAASSAAACTLDYEFAVMKNLCVDFQSMYKANNCSLKVLKTFNSGITGRSNLFGIPWDNFMADDSVYFINGVLHLRAQITINNVQA